MTPKEGFKYGFLLRCAEEGLTVKQAEARAARAIEKQADYGWTNAAKDLGGLALKVPGAVMSYGLPIGFGAMALGGAGLGYGLAKLQEGDVDPEEVQREELISAYRTQAELARRRAIMDAAQQAQPRPKSFHGI